MIKCFAPTVINGMNFHGVFYSFISCSCGIRLFVQNSLTAIRYQLYYALIVRVTPLKNKAPQVEQIYNQAVKGSSPTDM
jgi:hypothetical protein